MRFNTLLWLSLFGLILHNLEEYLTMPSFVSNRWQSLPHIATQFITPVPNDVFFIMLIEVTILAAIVTYWGTKSAPNSTGMILAMSVVTSALLFNGLHHFSATLLLQVYTPGVISSLLLIPFAVYICRRAFVEGQITSKLLGWSMVLGIVIMLPIIFISRYLAVLMLS